MRRLLVGVLLVGVVGCGKGEYDTSMDAPAPLDKNQAILAQLQGRYPPGPVPGGWAGKRNKRVNKDVAKGDIETVKKHLAAGADVPSLLPWRRCRKDGQTRDPRLHAARGISRRRPS